MAPGDGQEHLDQVWTGNHQLKEGHNPEMVEQDPAKILWDVQIQTDRKVVEIVVAVVTDVAVPSRV